MVCSGFEVEDLLTRDPKQSLGSEAEIAILRMPDVSARAWKRPLGIRFLCRSRCRYGDKAIVLIGHMRIQVSVDEEKLSGSGFQTNGDVGPAVVLTLSILRLNNNPDPFSGVKSSEKADIRRVLIPVAGIGRMFAETFQLLAVSPPEFTNGAEKVTTSESKVKSPWKPT